MSMNNAPTIMRFEKDLCMVECVIRTKSITKNRIFWSWSAWSVRYGSLLSNTIPFCWFYVLTNEANSYNYVIKSLSVTRRFEMKEHVANTIFVTLLLANLAHSTTHSSIFVTGQWQSLHQSANAYVSYVHIE